jgi:hypothetical protein
MMIVFPANTKKPTKTKSQSQKKRKKQHHQSFLIRASVASHLGSWLVALKSDSNSSPQSNKKTNELPIV